MRSRPASSPCDEALDRWCQRWLPATASAPLVAVAFSGGADSTALLLATRARWPGNVVALHVHHGLQAAADDFEIHVRATCQRLAVPVQVRRVQARHAPGQSPEDAARVSRYAALAGMALETGAGCVLLGQHADDQAETLLLALSRGAGLPGLSGMPERFERHGAVFGRPFLALAGQALREHLATRGEAFVEDPSNTDTRYTRNRIRVLLMPAWQACFPGFRSVLARSARHAAQAQVLLDDLARMDLARTGVPPTLSVLQTLSPERQANALRHWLGQYADVTPSAAQMEALLKQVAACTTRGHRIHLKVADGFVTRAGPVLAYTPSI